MLSLFILERHFHQFQVYMLIFTRCWLMCPGLCIFQEYVAFIWIDIPFYLMCHFSWATFKIFFFCLVFSILSIIILAFCFHQCVYFCLFICLHGFFFIYILLGVCSAFQICKFISFTQFWNFFPNNFLSYSLSFSSVTLI